MNSIEKQVEKVLHNLNWLMKPHDSYAELVEMKGNKVIIRGVGSCDTCDTDCIGIAFKESIPGITLVRKRH